MDAAGRDQHPAQNLPFTPSVDAGEILEDAERPARFEDVIGADSAKEELILRRLLENPRRFGSSNRKKSFMGAFWHGKTMLARAVAGESNIAFIASATNFVTHGKAVTAKRGTCLHGRADTPQQLSSSMRSTRLKSPPGLAQVMAEMALNALLTEMDGFTHPR